MKKVNSNLGTNEAYGINTARGTNAEMMALTPLANLTFFNEDNNCYYYADGTKWNKNLTYQDTYKAGKVAGTSFSGTPQKSIVTFNSPMVSAYSISILGIDGVNRVFTAESITLNGFTINSNANPGFTDSVHWIAILDNDL
jgi:hypothetical protein